MGSDNFGAEQGRISCFLGSREERLAIHNARLAGSMFVVFGACAAVRAVAECDPMPCILG